MIAATPPRMDTSSWILLLTLSVLWGASFFFAKVALTDIPPFTLVLARVGIAALVLLGFTRLLRRQFQIRRADWAVLIGLGLFNNAVPYALLFWGQTQIASGLAAIVNAMTPFSAALLAHVMLRDEKLSAVKLTGILIGIAGVVVIFGPNSLGGVTGHALGLFACLGATVSYGLAAIIARRASGMDPLNMATGQLLVSSSIMAPIVLLFDKPWTLAPPSLNSIAAILALSIFSTAVAYLFYFRIIQNAGATNGALVTLLVPVSAILLGALFLGERLPEAAFVGLAVIMVGLLVADGRVLSRRYRRTPASRRTAL